MKSFKVYTEAKLSTSEKLNRNLKKGGFDTDASLARIEAIRKKYAQPQNEPKKEVKENYGSFDLENRLGPKATELQDREEIKRQKEHLTQKAKENHAQSKREGGGGAAEAKAISYEKARDSIKEDGGAIGAAPTNSVAGVAGTGDSRLPASQREPGVSKKRNPILKGMFTRKPPKA